ncbi:RNA polymerase sigma factor [Nocardia wallacei]|uniref:RNA polymerase sigma factor n=1 Tax=Nocardia wallacei TaxID=480035 RepID=UPI002455B0BD|nr:RNA polymerase sigma factor [Nocardia wallacei]
MSRRAEFEEYAYKEYTRFLKYELMLCGNKNLAEDLVQEAFLKLWKSKGPLENRYMYRISKSVYIDYLRKLNRQPPGSYIGDFDEDKFIEESDDSEGVDEVLEAILDLPAEQQTVVYLRHFQEMTTEEISKETGYTPAQVSRYLYRAHTKLQKKLRKYAKHRTKKNRATK